ncbi:B-box domain protein 31 [Sesamum alatum]|uniref:B-box domain protein 31 n=1 Tax=Sesamum alatum TaxID=300844 RepID=A0AAE1XYP5_9LAMI|nr:B-box domain protein 31 [Sesamum alatum]
MCRRIREDERQLGCCWKGRRPRKEISCELCRSDASVYCAADGAFLCSKCDGIVHAANFLAGRHVRRLLCRGCRSLTRRYIIGTSPGSLEVIVFRRMKMPTFLFL